MSQPLKIATFNAENFYLLLDKDYSRVDLEALDEATYQGMNSSIYNRNKDRRKVAEVARLILDGDYDVVGLCEVGGMETLAAFNRLYLDDRYEPFLHEENSRRGIFVGALVKRGQFPTVRASSLPGDFSRNLLRISLGEAGFHLVIYIVHLKSQFGRDLGIGPRLEEVGRLAKLVHPNRCVVMGDFNGILIRGESQFEYDAFLKLPFRDVLEAVGVPPNQRRTHYHFGPEPHFTQLDYLFCSNDLVVFSGGVVEGEIPLNRAQREYLPSDHLMVWAEVGLEGMKKPAAMAVEPVEGTPGEPGFPVGGWVGKLWGWVFGWGKKTEKK